MTRFTSGPALVLLLCLVSCTKQETKNTPTPPTPQQLVLGDWKMTGLTSDVPVQWVGNGNSSTDGYSQLPDCFKDNILRFNSNGQYSSLEGSSKCDPSDSDTFFHSSWVILTYPTMVINNDTATIKQLDANTFKWTTRETYNTVEAQTTYTLSR